MQSIVGAHRHVRRTLKDCRDGGGGCPDFVLERDSGCGSQDVRRRHHVGVVHHVDGAGQRAGVGRILRLPARRPEDAEVDNERRQRHQPDEHQGSMHQHCARVGTGMPSVLCQGRLLPSADARNVNPTARRVTRVGFPS